MPSEFETKLIHAGIEPDPVSGAVMTPIYQTSTYAQSGPGQHLGYEYGRTDNPTRTALQTQLAALESADRAFVFSSGMAAIDTVMNLLRSGDHVVAADDLYGGTRRLFTRIATERGITFSFCPMESRQQLADAIQPNTRLIWLETPTNPTLKLIDLGMVASVAKDKGVLSVVDNTFMSPYFQRPLELGISIVMHSMTKFINGHSDVVMGALMLRDDVPANVSLAEGMGLAERIKFLQNSIGAVPGPFECWLVLRGIKTMAVRMDRIAANAMELATWLESHPKVSHVIYPGLPSHPQHDLAQKQMFGMGGMISFGLKSDLEGARSFLSKVQVFTLAESLGGVESLIEHPAIMTHASVPPDVRASLGIGDAFIRVSTGIEHINDLKADLDQAMAGL